MVYNVTLYTKDGCHLCEEASEMLSRLAPKLPLTINSIDITSDPEIYERFKYAIPVIEVDGEVRLGGRFSEDDLHLAIVDDVRQNAAVVMDAIPLVKEPMGRQSGKRPRIRSSIMVATQLLAAILLVSAIFWILDERNVLPGRSSAGDTLIPRSIAGYQLQQTVTGQGAIDELVGMHGKDVELSSAWIGRYQAGGVVWYGDIISEAKASELITRMSSKIRAGNPTFTDLRQFRYEGVDVFSVVGTGQQHFFYQSGKKLIWLAAPRGGEGQFLKDALRVLK